MTHERWSDAVAAYLLGALDDDERVGFEAHLEGCPDCREELEFLRVASDALPVSAPQIEPPPELKDRIMSVVNAEAQLLSAAGAPADEPPKERTGRAWRWLRPPMLAAVAAAVLIVGVLVGVLVRSATGPVTRTVVAQVEEPGASARLEQRGDRAELIASGLPDPGPGRVYQVWIKRPGAGPQPTAALFTTDRSGDAEVGVPGSLDGVEAVLVTSEPAGGSTTPTRAPVIAVEPA